MCGGQLLWFLGKESCRQIDEQELFLDSMELVYLQLGRAWVLS
jgi:hypothetical protein